MSPIDYIEHKEKLDDQVWCDIEDKLLNIKKVDPSTELAEMAAYLIKFKYLLKQARYSAELYDEIIQVAAQMVFIAQDVMYALDTLEQPPK